MKVVFLYTELASYFVACCKELSLKAEVHVFRWPVNKEAPFDFDLTHLNCYNKKDFTFDQLQKKVNEIAPDVIICSGWIDSDYNKLVKCYKNKIPTVVAFDTSWRGDLKQQLLKIASPFFIHNRFSHAWVPGKIQKHYAQKLGFSDSKIKEGFYSCDVDLFNSIYKEFGQQKKSNFPKRFLYVGRYYEFKGIKQLWQAFIELQSEFPNDWELWCAGTGDLNPVLHPKIKHLGFVQPDKMKEILGQTGVFILPSHFEPWGVVVHEHAAAGFPLLLSTNVGAASAFLENGKNGILFNSENIADIKHALKQIILLNSTDLNSMAVRSHEIAQQINTHNWVNTILNFKLN